VSELPAGGDWGWRSASRGFAALWLLGYAEAALEDAERALEDAREIGQAATLINALSWTLVSLIYCGNYAAGSERADEAVALADEKGSLFWKANGMLTQGWVFALTGKASNAVQMINSGITAIQSTGAAKLLVPWLLSHLAWAHGTLGHHDEAWRCIGEVMTAMAMTTLVRGRGPSRSWRNRADVAGGRHSKGGSLFRTFATDRARATVKVLGAARGDEHGAAVARSREAG
jgi:hypothetical protein